MTDSELLDLLENGTVDEMDLLSPNGMDPWRWYDKQKQKWINGPSLRECIRKLAERK